MSEDISPIDIFEDHGVHYTVIPDNGKQAIGDCPICGKEGHFFTNQKTGQSDCKVCSWKGNAYTFLKTHHEHCLDNTKTDHYRELSSQRSDLPHKLLHEHKLAWDAGQQRWLIPAFNAEGGCVNLYHWKHDRDPKGPLSTKGCKQHILGADQIRPTGTIWICEGYFDLIALSFLFQKNKIDPGINSILAAPGAAQCHKEFAKKCASRDVVLLFDHDEAGYAGMDSLEKLLIAEGCKVRRIRWPKELPEHYDLRDHVTSRLKDHKAAWKKLLAYLENDTTVQASYKLPKRETFASVVKDFKKNLHMKQSQIDALAIMTAIVASNCVKNDPLWAFLVGPPGSGKSVLIEAYRGLTDRCYYISKFTDKAFISGFKTDDGTDASLLDRIQGMTLLVQDYTAMMDMPPESLTSLQGTLRTAYDGEAEVEYGNGEVRKFPNSYFTHIAGVTHVIYGRNQSSLGERFLRVRLLGDDHNVDAHLDAALDSVDAAPDRLAAKKLLTDSLAGFFACRKLDPKKLAKTPKWVRTQVKALAQVGAVIRTAVERAPGGAMLFRPEVEIGGRLAKQLALLGKFLCWVFNTPTWTDEVLNIVRRVAVTTVTGWNLELISALAHNPKGIPQRNLPAMTHASETTILKHLTDLQEIQFSHAESFHQLIDTFLEEDEEGRTIKYWKLHPHFIQFWKDSHLDDVPEIIKFRTHRGPKQGSKHKPKAFRRMG